MDGGRIRRVEYALKSFANSDPALLAAINLWAAQAPDFYAPAAARGIYNWHLGTMATNAGNASAPEQQKVAEQFFAEAARDLEAALAIEPNLSTAYAVLIDIEIQRGAHDRAFEQLRRGLEQQPRSFVIREQYLDGLVPWRNTHMSQSQALAKLDEFVADARVSAGLYPELRALGGYDDYVRSQLGQRSGQLDQATAAIESAMAKEVTGNTTCQKGRLLRARDRCAPAMAAYDTALSARPDVAWCMICWRCAALSWPNRGGARGVGSGAHVGRFACAVADEQGAPVGAISGAMKRPARNSTKRHCSAPRTPSFGRCGATFW